jgi:hypothetical protein
MDSNLHLISSDMWYTTWFLTVREIWPCEVGNPKNGQEAPSWLTLLIERVKWL